MAVTNHERVGKAMEFLKQGLQPFVEREMKAQHAQRWFEEARDSGEGTATMYEGSGSGSGSEAGPALFRRWAVRALRSEKGIFPME